MVFPVAEEEQLYFDIQDMFLLMNDLHHHSHYRIPDKYPLLNDLHHRKVSVHTQYRCQVQNDLLQGII